MKQVSILSFLEKNIVSPTSNRDATSTRKRCRAPTHSGADTTRTRRILYPSFRSRRTEYVEQDLVFESLESETSHSQQSRIISDATSDNSCEFMCVIQKACISLLNVPRPPYDTRGDGKILDEPLLKLDSQIIKQRNAHITSPSFGFSSSQFLGDTLNIICGYFRGSFVELFDLEDVDEATCSPLRTFDMSRITGSAPTLRNDDLTPSALDVAAINNHLAVCGLSNGVCSWLDVRQRYPILCTPNYRSLSSMDLSNRYRRSGSSPVTSLKLCSSGANYLATGSRDGMLVLWDVRKISEAVDEHACPSEIGRISAFKPTNTSRTGCQNLWVNDFKGNIMGFGAGQNGFVKHTHITTHDACRGEKSLHNPTQKHCVQSESNLLYYPHITSNTMMIFDLDKKQRLTNSRNKEFQDAAKIDTIADENIDFVETQNEIQSIAPSQSIDFENSDIQISSCSALDVNGSIVVGSSDGIGTAMLRVTFTMRNMGLGDAYVKKVFDSVASKYDMMNDVLSLGVHRLWKKYYVETCVCPFPGGAFLDVAGGTGDIAFRITDAIRSKEKSLGVIPKDLGETKVVVCDINEKMLEEGKKRAIQEGYFDIQWQCANGEELPFEPASFDSYTVSFGIRNFSDKPKALREAFRVLKVGGVLNVLEFSKVDCPWLSIPYDAWSYGFMPQAGRLLADEESYRYLVDSIRSFPDQETFAQMIKEAGFGYVRYENLSGGIACIHTAVKTEPMESTQYANATPFAKATNPLEQSLDDPDKGIPSKNA